ncbi:hypothetical protein SALBM311S_06994 [Streptomyces alboniger]
MLPLLGHRAALVPGEAAEGLDDEAVVLEFPHARQETVDQEGAVGLVALPGAAPVLRRAADARTGQVATVYKVSGMTCGHCEGAVSQEVSALDGVTAVTAVAKSGEVTITSAAPLDEEAVRAAVDEAGYELVGTA